MNDLHQDLRYFSITNFVPCTFGMNGNQLMPKLAEHGRKLPKTADSHARLFSAALTGHFW